MLLPHFTDEYTEARREYVTCSRSHSGARNQTQFSPVQSPTSGGGEEVAGAFGRGPAYEEDWQRLLTCRPRVP